MLRYKAVVVVTALSTAAGLGGFLGSLLKGAGGLLGG
jgi:hypothetical protein